MSSWRNISFETPACWLGHFFFARNPRPSSYNNRLLHLSWAALKSSVLKGRQTLTPMLHFVLYTHKSIERREPLQFGWLFLPCLSTSWLSKGSCRESCVRSLTRGLGKHRLYSRCADYIWEHSILKFSFSFFIVCYTIALQTIWWVVVKAN